MSHNMFDLKEAIERAKSGIKTRDTGEFAKIAYLRDGKHKLRILRDPNGEIFRYVMIHQVSGTGKKCLCPNYLREINIKKYGDLPPCEICKQAEDSGQWRFNRKYQVLMYAYLYDTNSSDEYWKPGNPYLVVGRTKMRDSVLAFLEGLLNDASDYVNSMLDPHVSGGVVSIDVVGGPQGSVGTTAIPGMTKPPIDTEGWYRPLADSFISSEFDEISYLEVLSLTRDRIAALVAAKGEGDTQTAQTGETSSVQAPAPTPASAAPAQTAPTTAPAAPAPTPAPTAPTPAPVAQVAPTPEPAPVAPPAPVVTPPEPAPAPAAKTDKASEPEDSSPPFDVSNSAPNTVFTKTRRTITLPDFAVARQCWTKFNQSDSVCASCPIQLDCLYEQSNSKIQK